LVEAVAGEMLLIANAVPDGAAARARVQEVIRSGAALARFRAFVVAQGGDGSQVDDPTRLPQAPVRHDVVAPVAGCVQQIDARRVGLASVALGGGRQRKGDPIDPRVGVMLAAKVGTQVHAGAPLCTIHAADSASAHAVVDELQAAFTIGPQFVAPLSIVLDRVVSG
jgi:pyrimidine-nucleoside phosphorylase